MQLIEGFNPKLSSILRSFWRRHKKKIYGTLGILGSGYLLYKLYDYQKRRISELERELAAERENDERIKAQMQEHFETIQRIADTTTLPHAMNFLCSRINEELNLSVLTESLKQGKNTLTLQEKLELWDRLKVLSFTKMVSSLWAMTVLNLFVRVQVNILGRHLYIDIAKSLESSPLPEEGTLIDHNDEQKFLSIADFLASHSLPALINNMHAAAAESLKSKQLKDAFTSSTLQETVMQILDTFMSMGRPCHWIEYIMPECAKLPSLSPSSSAKDLIPADLSKFEQLKTETQAVLSSDEFRNVVEVSLRTVADALVKEVLDQSGVGTPSSGTPLVKLDQSGVGTPSSGTPLVKLVPRVVQMSRLLLDEPTRNQLVQMIGNIHEVDLFFTILYASTSTV